MLCVPQVSTYDILHGQRAPLISSSVCSNIAEMDAMQWMIIRNVPMPIYVSTVERTQLCRGIQSIHADGICIHMSAGEAVVALGSHNLAF